MNMKQRLYVLPLLTMVVAGAGVTWAASDGTVMEKPMHGEMHGGPREMLHGGMMPSPFLMALRQLNLSETQHESVKSLLDAAKQQREAGMKEDRSSLEALGNPGDANYDAAVQSAKSLAAKRIQQRADLETQIYNLLTAEQKAALPKAVADVKAKFMERREHWDKRQHDHS